MTSPTKKVMEGRDSDATGGRPDARISRRTVLGAAFAATAAAWLGAAFGGRHGAFAAPPGPAPEAGGELVYGLTNRFDTLDPNVTTFSDVGRISYHLFDTLVWESKPGGFVPGLAEKWEISAAADQYTFHLRKDVKFHDGTPLTAEAVKFTFDRIVDPDLKSQSAFSSIGPYDSTQVVDPYTAVVKFKTPYAPFLSSAAGSDLAPVSPDAVKK